MSQIGKNTTFGPFAVRYFPFTHCQKSLGYFSPVQENAATFSPMFAIRKNPHFQALGRVVVFFLYTAKNHLYYSPNKILKTSHCNLSVLNQEKTPPSGNFAVRFFPCTHCQNSICTICPNNWAFTLSQSLGKIYNKIFF